MPFSDRAVIHLGIGSTHPGFLSRGALLYARHTVSCSLFHEHRMTEMRDVRLPADLCAAAEKRFGHVFGSLEELLVFVLRDLLRDEPAAQIRRNRDWWKTVCANWDISEFHIPHRSRPDPLKAWTL